MSYNPNYRPSDPPQVGSQQFNNAHGTSQQRPGYGAGQYQDQGQYSNPSPYQQPQSGPAIYGQPDAYSQQGAYSQPDAYSQQGAYSQPGAYGYSEPGAYSQPGAYGYSEPGAYSQPGGYGYSQPMSYGTPMMVRPAVNTLASWSMWMGIIGLGGSFICGLLSMIPFIGILFSIVLMFLWIAPILAVIFGHVSRGQIKKTGEDGQGQSTAGLVLGYVSIGLGLLGLIIIVGVVGLGVFAAGMGY